MNDRPFDDDEMPAEIDFGNGVRGLHHIPSGAKVFLPTSISGAFGNTSPVKPSKKVLACRNS
jgi:hypothetical protein